ncbi:MULTISPECIES: D-alanyl-lipoteichoic acid biosynthesis protein DltB [Gemella]|uniref:D-alanyl-lipoteichoic acid biosynthesis protein DltB n=1 Tax=Gemella TaxID=1378 RepID=UPI0007684DE5|nr:MULTISPECIES: D-alanyl-lipoteichoic acid biosynthesis protein DltB [Gemella]AME09975.1 D-alanyl-lipoteichoic acid biosynthesis protein DltB [Gemella sp. oral taxon 928]AXI26115.1 D-alanyl-lipoteichoic acid biosynthesis protein DltB [Gemella sp. ND 6198]
MNYFEGNEFFFFLIIALLVGFILKLFRKNIEYYILLLSIVFAGVIYGKSTLMLCYLVIFIVFEYLLVFIAQRNTNNKKLLKLLIFISIAPLVLNKIFTLASIQLFTFIGISYMSFKTIQIIVEIYDGVIKEKILPVEYLNFLLFFPTISSGPIDRSRRFKEDIKNDLSKKEYFELAGEGVYRLILGLLYKVVISTYCYHYLITLTNHGVISYSVKYMYLYTLYLFFDFAGYSLMAVGSSNILGIQTPLNFNKPFLSVDIKDFWNRWHITLSTWLRDFVFSRVFISTTKKKIFKTRLNTAMYAYMVNMILMGLWHGLTFSYIIYGVYHGILMACFEYYQKKVKFYKRNRNKKWYKVVSWVITLNLITFGLFIFSGEAEKVIRVILKV